MSFLLGDETSRHYETTYLRPTMGTMLEVSHFPIAIDGSVAQAGQQARKAWVRQAEPREQERILA